MQVARFIPQGFQNQGYKITLLNPGTENYALRFSLEVKFLRKELNEIKLLDLVRNQKEKLSEIFNRFLKLF
jgi:predicted CoA-binding protein